MGRLKLSANVRLVGVTDTFPKEEFDKIIEENYKGKIKEYEKVAKQDFIRAIESDLGFKREEINVTKFVVEYIDEEVNE